MPSEPILVNSSISSTGDITAVKFYGDGSGLVNITTTNLPTPRTIAATGDATWSVSFDGTQNVSGVLTLANSGVTAGTYTKVTVDAKGRVTTGTNLVSGDLPSHTHTIAQISDGSVLVKTTDTATVTNTMLAGGIANAKLVNSTVTLNGVSVALGGTATIPSSSAGTLTIGSYLTGGSYNGSGNVTIAANASSANGSSTLVARDASGNFSAGIITATLNGLANNISQYVVNQDVGLTSSPSFTQVTATTSLRASGTNGIVYLNRSSNASISEVNFQTASSTNWKLGLAATATPNISFATADGNSRLTLTQAGVLTVSGGITAVRYPRPSVNGNLGNPTVEEIAMFGAQMSNKIRGVVPYLQEESADGTTWSTSTRLTASQLAGIVVGDGNLFGSPVIIPIATVGSSGHYRLTWDATNTGYVWLNAFYAYLSTKGSNVIVKVEIYNNDLAAWSTVVSGTVNGWPNHIYIPHDAVLFSTFSGAAMHRYARVTFSLASSVYGSEYGGVELSSVEWMGGYPAGRRNVEYYDTSLNAHWAGSVYASSFVDENNTTYYLDPSSTGTALTVAGAATVGRGIGGGEAIALVLSSAEGGAGGATSIRAFPRGAGGTSNASARIRFTSSTGPSAGIQFYTGGTVGGVTSESLVLTLNSGATSAAFAGDLSVGGNLTVTGSISAASFTGTISSSGTANTLTSLDNRVINPSETSISRAQFGFTSWNNDNTGPYADYLHMRSYTDASGGSDNLVMFRKTGIGMRIWQQTFGSADAYSTYKDIAFTDGTNATGTWTLNTSGYAAYIQGSEIALAFATAPRTSTQPFSVKLFDNYNTAGWPAQYGTIMEIYGKVGHQIDQLHFGNDRKIYHRSAFYNENTWTSFQKILEADDTSSTNVANKIVIRDASGNFSAGTITANLTGNASTVTNGVYTTGSYANPAWITSLDASKLTGDQTIPNVVLPGQLRTEQISTTSLAAGAWYTIATNDGNRANGKFIITDATPGLHQSVHFYASHHYGAGNKISIIHNDSYGGGGPVRYIRIKEGGTYDGAMLQIYVDDAVTGALPLRIYLYEDVQANGWALKNFIPDGTDPGGTGNFANLTNVAAQVDLDLGATIFSGNIYSGTSTNTGQFKVYNTSDASSLTVQNSLVLRDGTGAFSAGSITLTGAPLAIGSGGTNATTAAGARTSLGATTVGSNIFTLPDPSAIRFLRLNADNTVSALSAEDFKTAIGAGSGGGSVTSVSGTGSVNGITLTGTVTTNGQLTLGGTLSNVSLTSQVTGTLPIANGGTNATTNVGANTNVANFGQLESHSAYTDFNTVPSTWGFTFVHQPGSNAPHANSTQWYRGRLSLGSGYGIGTTASSYWLELAMPRSNGNANGNLYFRTTEAGVTGAWYGVRAAYAETAGSVTGGIYTTGDQTITGVKTFNDTIKASRIEASSSTNISLVPAGASGEVAIRRGSDDNLAFTLRPTGSNNGYIRSGSATGVFTVDSNDFRVRSYEQDVDRLRITSTESVFASPLRVTGNLTAGDGLFINTNVASRSYFDANTGAYFHTPGAMVRKDSASNVPGEMPATFVLYNRNGGNDTGTKLVFSSSESSSATSNAVATAAIVSQKVSATDGNWGVGNLRFYVKNVGVYEEVLTLNASKTAAFKGPIQLENNVAQYWLDSAGNSRRVSLVSGGNASYFGPVDAGWGSTTYLSAGTAMILRTNGGGGTFVEAVTLATGGNVTVAKDLIVNGTGGITVSTSSGATPVITATSTNGVAGYFVSDGHLNDLQANTSTHFVIKRSKNTATQNRWAMQLQGGENTSDSPVEGSNLVFVYSSAGTGTWTNGLTLYRNGNALIAGSATTGGALTVNSTITAANTIKYVNSGVANGTVVGPLAADIGADATLGALQVTVGGSPSATGSSRFGYIGAGDVGAWRRIIVGSNNTSGGGQVLVPSTLTSDSTSSGALVVSGGVGIGGSVHVGGGLSTTSTLSTSAGIIGQNILVNGGYMTLTGYGNADGGLIFLGQSSNNNFLLSSATKIGTRINNVEITKVEAGGFTVNGNINADPYGSASANGNVLISARASSVALTTTLRTDQSGNFNVVLNDTSRTVYIPQTTTSSDTSTGALVIGNGTSGGLGVGGVINAGSGTHIFGNAAATAQLRVQRITTNPSSVQINATASFANIDFGSEGGGYTFGAIRSNGSEILRIHDANLAPITNVSGGGLAVGGGIIASGTIVSNRLFTTERKLEAHVPHAVSTEDYLKIGSNSGSTNTYAAEYGYGLTSVGDPQIRINRIHAGTVSRWLSGRTTTGNAIFANSLGIGGIGGADDPASRLHVYENTSTVGDSNGITIEQAGTSDATIQFVLTSVQRWSMGVDNSDSDRFKIGTGNLGAADRFVLDTSGNTAIAGNLTVNGTGTSTFATGSTIRSSGTVSIDSGTSANRYDIYRDGTGAASRLGHLITYGSQTGYGAFTWANVDNGQIFDLYNTGNADLWGNMTIGRRSAGDSIIKLWRSQGGNEWVQLAAHSGGSLGNNQYSLDLVNGVAARPFYFRRSTDAGTSYTNFLTWDTSNNATFAGSISATGSVTAEVGLIKTGTNAGTARLFNDGNVQLVAASGVTSDFYFRTDGTIRFTNQNATTTYAVIQSGLTSIAGSISISGNTSNGSSGGLTLKLGKIAGVPSNATDAFIAINDTGGPGTTAGDLIYIPRSTSGISSAHRWYGHTSGTIAERMSLTAAGQLTVSGSISASTVTTSGAITVNADPTGDRSAITRVWSVSRGQNLVTNGSGLMGNNYNFSGLTFDAVQTHGGGGSFRATAAYGSYTSDEFLPVDPEKNYRFALWARSGQDGGVDYSASNQQYAGIVPYDIDGLTIFPFTYSKYPGSTDTTLAATLNPGDTTVTLTSTAGWANTGSANYQRQFGWYGYTNSKGYTYPNYTYTRNYTWNYTVYQGDPAGAWSVGGISGNVITLNAPWPGPTVAAGTAIRNINSGGTFKYITLGATSVPNTWTRYEGYIGGLDTGGTQNTNQFPYGTAFVKLLFLSNYHGVANNTIRFSDLWFSEMSSRNLEPATDTFAGVVSTASQTFAGAKTFSTDVRAPIFYDSVDTGYWISPRSAQTSSEGGRIKRNFTVNAEGSGTGYGLALYPQYTAQALPTYGIVFGQTGTLGTHGAVSGDWATYFTMNNTSGRGWVFRNTSDGINVASVSNTGVISCKTVVAGTPGSTVGSAALVVNGTAGEDDSQLIIKKPSQSTFSVLAWNAINYIGSNVYYNNGNWVHDGPNTNSQLFAFEPGVGVKWWASSNSSSTWDLSNQKILWDQYGQWQSTLTNTLTLNTSGTGLSGSTTFNNSGAATFTVTSNATSANTASTIVARDASGNFSAGTITATLTGTASALVTSGNYQVNSLGVGTAASATAGEIRATNNVTAYYSDERLKTRLGGIEDPLKKVMSLSGFYFAPNDTAMALGYQKKVDVGVSAQEVQKVLPEIIAPAPIDPQYMTVRYEKMIPLLIEAIKEQQSQIEELKNLVAKLTNK